MFLPSTTTQLQFFARGFSPMPHKGTADTLNDLRQPEHPSSLRLTDYPQQEVQRRLQEFCTWSDGWQLDRILDQDYTTDRGDRRIMSQHGGTRDTWGRDRGLQFTYSSHTYPRNTERHFYNLMFGAAPQGPDVIGWRDLAMVAMVPSPLVTGAERMVTGASGVVITMRELSQYVQSRTGVWTANPFELAAYLYSLNYGTAFQDIKVEQLADSTFKAENKYDDRYGGVFLNTVLEGGLAFVVVNNVQVNPRQQARRLCIPGVVPTGPGFTGLIADPTGQARDGNRDIEARFGDGGIHAFYRRANDYVRGITGMDLPMVALPA